MLKEQVEGLQSSLSRARVNLTELQRHEATFGNNASHVIDEENSQEEDAMLDANLNINIFDRQVIESRETSAEAQKR